MALHRGRNGTRLWPVLLAICLFALAPLGRAEGETGASVPAPRYVYFLSNPITTDSKLPKSAAGFHVGGQVAYHALIGYWAYTSVSLLPSGSPLFDYAVKPLLVVGPVAYEALKLPIVLPAQVSLNVRAMQALRKQPHVAQFLEQHPRFAEWVKGRRSVQWLMRHSPLLTDLLTKQPYLARLAKIPGMKRISVITSIDPSGKMLSKSHQDSDFVILETSKPLPASALNGETSVLWDASWGKPLHMKDPAHTKVQLSLDIGGKRLGKKWAISIEDLIQGPTLRPDVAESWRKAYEKVAPSLFAHVFKHAHSPEVRVDATIIQEPEKHRKRPKKLVLENVLSDGAAAHFIGETYRARTVRWMQRHLLTRWIPAGLAHVPVNAVSSIAKYDQLPKSSRDIAETCPLAALASPTGLVPPAAWVNLP